MPDHELSSTTIILLGSILGSLLMLLVLVIGISRKVTRISQFLATLDPSPQSDASNLTPNPTPNSSFESFLNEDPSRTKLTKNEQFAAYRKWRQENGLNWSAS